MPNLFELGQESCHGISMRSNAGSVEPSRRSMMRETSPTLDDINPPHCGLGKFNLNEQNQQAGITGNRRTRDWVNSCPSFPLGRGNIMERRDGIDKQLRATNKLADELARTKSGSVQGLEDKAKCQDLQFVGSWVDEKDKHS